MLAAFPVQFYGPFALVTVVQWCSGCSGYNSFLNRNLSGIYTAAGEGEDEQDVLLLQKLPSYPMVARKLMGGSSMPETTWNTSKVRANSDPSTLLPQLTPCLVPSSS